jgi:hypothetical protein
VRVNDVNIEQFFVAHLSQTRHERNGTRFETANDDDCLKRSRIASLDSQWWCDVYPLFQSLLVDGVFAVEITLTSIVKNDTSTILKFLQVDRLVNTVYKVEGGFYKSFMPHKCLKHLPIVNNTKVTQTVGKFTCFKNEMALVVINRKNYAVKSGARYKVGGETFGRDDDIHFWNKFSLTFD